MSQDLAADLALAQQVRFEKLWRGLSPRARRIVARALDQLERDLAKAKPGSWSAASSAATLVQIADAVRGLSSKQLALLRRALPTIAEHGALDVVAWLRRLDKSFLGAPRPIRWDSLEWLSQTRDPMLRSRLRIYKKSFARYGAEAVSAIEDALVLNVLEGTPWTEAREQVMDIVREQVGGKQWMVDRIIRTESATIYNSMALEALRAEDEDDPWDPMQKKLVATWDAVTGADSIALHGQTKPIGEPFMDISGREYMAPPNRPNDREIVVGWRSSWGGDAAFDRETASSEITGFEPG